MGSKQVGLVGLGLVGKALVSRFLGADWSVTGYDIDPAARNTAAGMGAHVVARLADLGPGRSLFVLSLPNSAIVNDVLWGPEGIGEQCAEGSVVVDTTTAEPEDTVRHHARLAERGVRFVDAPLVGSSKEIEAGEGVALVGAEDDGAAFMEAVRVFAGKVYCVGGVAQGHRAKLVVNLVLGLNRLVLAEGLALAGKVGLAPTGILDILKNSAAYSRVMDTKGTRMIEEDFEPVARLAQHAKDVGLINRMASEAGARTPVSELHARILREAVDAGWGGLDNAAVIKAFL